jgi:uncharacterized membrane protein YphA (DoxX/SURF4 family)
MLARIVMRTLLGVGLLLAGFGGLACNEPQEQMMTGETQQHPMDQQGIDSHASE